MSVKKKPPGLPAKSDAHCLKKWLPLGKMTAKTVPRLTGQFQSLVNLQLKVFSDDLKPGGREQHGRERQSVKRSHQ
ncbi:MAG: hypothetical protein U1F65_12185 [Verrucomicrobiota bacterium]